MSVSVSWCLSQNPHEHIQNDKKKREKKGSVQGQEEDTTKRKLIKYLKYYYELTKWENIRPISTFPAINLEVIFL